MHPNRDLPLPHDAGMSLIEVLVAVFIMALAAGMVAMTMRAPADPLEEAAARLERDITSAMDLALVTGAPQGLKLTDEGYQLVTWRNQAWLPAAGGKVSFARNVAFDRSRAPPQRSGNGPGSPNEAPPEVILDTTGTAQADPLILERDNQTIELTIAPDGKVTWEAPNA
ncbi:prepilin-type N-terminal cleavage/methylation domain-containing protein [Hyphomonas chukchiensis]|uniref:prepilin-type N-terminal cleavage/methylation domain-containing protein n=1 Tax=Hyphomonas chukchiensis TaxID=1280947 RepID=UPI0030FA8661